MGSTSLVLLWWLQSKKIRRGKKKGTAKTGIFHHVEKLLETSENHLFWEDAPHSHFCSPATQQRVKVWARIDWGEDSATMLKTHLLGERYAAYCNCKKLKESKLAGSFSEVFLLLLTLMRFSPYRSSINNFCCVASVKPPLTKWNKPGVTARWGAGKAKGMNTGGWILWIGYRYPKSMCKGSCRMKLCRRDGCVWVACCSPQFVSCVLAFAGMISASGKFMQ